MCGGSISSHLEAKFTRVVDVYKRQDLEGRKSTWLLVGYVVVLAFMFVAFEWTQRDVKIDTCLLYTSRCV